MDKRNTQTGARGYVYEVSLSLLNLAQFEQLKRLPPIALHPKTVIEQIL